MSKTFAYFKVFFPRRDLNVEKGGKNKTSLSKTRNEAYQELPSNFGGNQSLSE